MIDQSYKLLDDYAKGSVNGDRVIMDEAELQLLADAILQAMTNLEKSKKKTWQFATQRLKL